MVRLKRIYDEPAAQDGVRVLVDRLWPRGLSKEKAHLDRWEKELAPSDELRRWFGHDPEKWQEFRERYRLELEGAGEGARLKELARLCARGTVTLLYAAKDEEHNNAVVLKELLEDSSIG
ncbi:DUF488 domain-containing protein [Geomonas nitrogeniifigens]|uniref:DUF488 domain-containing protein n=1 Tax=Geomonas diazotrophica TaxID=2843197 RepID=A0ABX8JQR4_9BACT|nr:DUF488 domain-containing protein [Geomonas nitrogeniifigens]QWV99466.1 DUF488 domain-containing protein [Geomonas nitrogeniifigens]